MMDEDLRGELSRLVEDYRRRAGLPADMKALAVWYLTQRDGEPALAMALSPLYQEQTIKGKVELMTEIKRVSSLMLADLEAGLNPEELGQERYLSNKEKH